MKNESGLEIAGLLLIVLSATFGFGLLCGVAFF